MPLDDRLWDAQLPTDQVLVRCGRHRGRHPRKRDYDGTRAMLD
jgi:hypothetical protein